MTRSAIFFNSSTGSTAPVGVEVIHARHETMDPAEVGKQTGDAMRAILTEARGAKGEGAGVQ